MKPKVRFSIRCQVSCTCGWSAYRSIQVTGESLKDEMKKLAGAASYSHYKCRGFVVIKRVISGKQL